MSIDRKQARERGPDFGSLFRSLPGCYLVLESDLTVFAASDAYLETTKMNRDAVVGRNILDVLGSSSALAANARASFARVLGEKVPNAMPVQPHSVRRSEADGGGFEERHWSAINLPVLGKDGEVSHIIHSLEDATQAVRSRNGPSEHALQRAVDRTLEDVSARADEAYRQFFDGAPDAMIVVTDGRIEFLNARTETMFGYTRDELVGRPLEILIPERFRRVHGEHIGAFFARPESRSMGSGLELLGRRKGGSEFSIEIGLSPMRSDRGATVAASIRDVSERKRVDASGVLLAGRLTSAVESIEGAFALFDENDRLVLCNSSFRSLLSHLSGPVIGVSYDELLDAFAWVIDFPDDAARVRFVEERKSIRRRELVSTFDVRTCDGRTLRVSDRRTADGGSVKTIWDLTEDEHLAEALREARGIADAANDAKSEFLSSMSHELRTPLNAILGFAQLLNRDKKEPLSTRHVARVDQILKGGDHLLHLINDILDLARIEAGGVSISVEPVSVVEVIDEVMSTLEPMAARQSITLDVELLISEPMLIAADRTRFAQILMNLGSNAIKYNRDGGRVTFIVSRPTPRHLRISVRDTGMGIPVDKRDQLFQPFQRAGQETGPIEGTGIGLVISRRLARLMGGDLDFRRTEDEGSEFWVDVPLHDPVSRGADAA